MVPLSMTTELRQLIGICSVCIAFIGAPAFAAPELPAEAPATQPASQPAKAAPPSEKAEPSSTRKTEAAREQPAAEPARKAGAARVYVIPVRNEIGSAVLYVVRRGIKEAIEQEADALVLDVDTPGGALGPTLEIMEAIGKFPGVTIAYVNDEAMSAGAFISASTHEIWFKPRAIMGAAAPVAAGGQEVEATMKQKVVSYLLARVRAVSEGRGYRAQVVSAMVDADLELKIGDTVIKPKGSLLSLTAEEAAKLYGEPPQPLLSSGTAKDIGDLLRQRFDGQRTSVIELQMTWSETLAAWLNSIAPVLMGIGLLALFIEFKTPGFGVFGITGIILLGIVFASSYVAGLSGHEPVLFFALGLILLALELFVFPGAAVLGIGGVLLMFGSLIWAMADLWPNEPLEIAWTGDAFVRPLANMGLALLIAGALGALVIRFLPRGWIWDKLVLASAVDVAAQAPGGTTSIASTTSLVGARGVAATTLRPSGQVEIDGTRYEARVLVGTVQAGATVVVVQRTDFELIVEESAA